MDNITHTLTGLAISQAGFNRKTRFATFAIVVGSNLPDIDSVSGLWGNVTYLQHHRGFTHSVVGVVILGVALAGAIYFPGRKVRPKGSGPRLNAAWLLLACSVATGVHLLMDFTNSYGVRPFLPFSARWYAWGIEPIVDPLLWLVLFAGLGLPALFRLINEELGARKTGYRAGAVFSLCAVVAVWGLRDFSHRRALNMLDSISFQGTTPERIGVFPSFANPFHWTGVAENSQAFYVLPVDVTGGQLDPQDARIYRKPEHSPALEAALGTRTAEVFMAFARFPWPEVLPAQSGTTVIIRDLRFQRANARTGAFAIRIELDSSLHVRSQKFDFSGRFPAD